MKRKTLVEVARVFLLTLAVFLVCVTAFLGFLFGYPRSSLALTIMRISYAFGRRDFSGARLGSEGDYSAFDLSGFNLSEADLSEAYLWGCNLSGADLRGADLRRADPQGADLRGVSIDSNTNLDARPRLVWELVNRGGADRDLSGTNLEWEDLRGADLSRADLNDANLRWTDLGGANLIGANLIGANLRWADLRGADLSAADLSGADLYHAKVTDEQLSLAASLEGATMPDGTVHR